MSIVGGVRSDCSEIKSYFSFLIVVIFGYLERPAILQRSSNRVFSYSREPTELGCLFGSSNAFFHRLVYAFCFFWCWAVGGV